MKWNVNEGKKEYDKAAKSFMDLLVRANGYVYSHPHVWGLFHGKKAKGSQKKHAL